VHGAVEGKGSARQRGLCTRAHIGHGARVSAASPSTAPDQSAFLECYRGRQGALNHLAYMRMSKVLLTLELCRRAGLALAGRDLFDYGFGAGTFFRHCPRDARLFGVEMDAENVAAVRAMLAARGQRADLQTIDIAHWSEHPLLARRYDAILCSHVLEHLPDPTAFLRRMAECLGPGGVFIGLVPIHERVMEPRHVQRLDEAKIRAIGAAAGLHTAFYLEADPWLYWLQPIWTCESGWPHGLARVLSFGLGLVASALGPRVWDAAGRVVRPLTGSRFTQAAFIFSR
jgi:2-polyprenyl-3-methyl-5-hydroxy-6-metoxy-1,4-benzoquinol methylase